MRAGVGISWFKFSNFWTSDIGSNIFYLEKWKLDIGSNKFSSRIENLILVQTIILGKLKTWTKINFSLESELTLTSTKDQSASSTSSGAKMDKTTVVLSWGAKSIISSWLKLEVQSSSEWLPNWRL